MHILISQDTVIGLQALSEFAELIYTPDIDFTVQLMSSVDPNFRKTVTVNQQNSMVLQLVEVITDFSQFDEHFLPFRSYSPTLNQPLVYQTGSVCDHSNERYYAVIFMWYCLLRSVKLL